MKFDWQPLHTLEPTLMIRRGSLLKFRDTALDQELVLLLTEWRSDPQTPIALVRLTGSKAGINPVQTLPQEAIAEGGLTVQWLADNWNNWVWLDSDFQDAMLCEAPLSVDAFS